MCYVLFNNFENQCKLPKLFGIVLQSKRAAKSSIANILAKYAEFNFK